MSQSKACPLELLFVGGGGQGEPTQNKGKQTPFGVIFSLLLFSLSGYSNKVLCFFFNLFIASFPCVPTNVLDMTDAKLMLV